MEIRFAKIEDVPGILSLLKQVGLVHHRGRPDLFRSDAQKYCASQVIAMLDVPATPIFVAVEDGTVLGYGFCMIQEHKQDPVLEDRVSLYIDDLCVDENCRGKHIGTALYQHICTYATLNVWACNESALRFYEKCGLKPQKIGMETILEEA